MRKKIIHQIITMTNSNCIALHKGKDQAPVFKNQQQNPNITKMHF